jgi:hypothetical protein
MISVSDLIPILFSKRVLCSEICFRVPYQIRSSGLISFAIIRFRSNLTACGTRQASAIQYRDVRSLTCRKLAALRWLKPSLAIAAPYCWPVMALGFTIVWAFCRMRYRNTRIQVLLLRANDLRFDAEASVLMLRDAGQCALLAAG